MNIYTEKQPLIETETPLQEEQFYSSGYITSGGTNSGASLDHEKGYTMSKDLKYISYGLWGGIFFNLFLTALPIFVYTGADQGGAGWIIFLTVPTIVLFLIGLIGIYLVYLTKKIASKVPHKDKSQAKVGGNESYLLLRIFAVLCFCVSLAYFLPQAVVSFLDMMNIIKLPLVEEFFSSISIYVMGGLFFTGIIGSVAVAESSNTKVKKNQGKLMLMYSSVYWMLFLLLGPLYLLSMLQNSLMIP